MPSDLCLVAEEEARGGWRGERERASERDRNSVAKFTPPSILGKTCGPERLQRKAAPHLRAILRIVSKLQLNLI